MSGIKDLGRYNVRVHVARRAAIFKVSLASLLGEVGDADRRAAVGDAVRELVDRRSLVLARESELIARAVDSDVLGVLATEGLDGWDNVGLERPVHFPHGLGRVVGVAACAVPVARNRLGLVRHDDVVRFAYAVHNVAGHPDVVSRFDAGAGSDLVLPLSGHDLSVHAADLDAGEEARFEVRFDDLASKRDVGACRAVVRSLRSGESNLDRGAAKGACRRFGPSEWVAVLEESVLLLDAEPRLRREILVKGSLRGSAGVAGDSFSLGRVAVAEDEDVRVAAEGVPEDCSGLENHFGVLAGGLSSG